MLHNLTKKATFEHFQFPLKILPAKKGAGGMATEGSGSWAARELGQGWKVNPYTVVDVGKTAIWQIFRGRVPLNIFGLLTAPHAVSK